MSGKKKGGDAKFFTTTKKGSEIHELKQELNMPERDKKIDAVKKVIAAMTVGKDVSTLFTDVINNMQTDNIELKKLVYLYLINYAKSNPEKTLLAVNTFVRDTNDRNPLVRALAIRTMGCIRVERITEYLCEPLRRCLRDEDPYVRKTAAVCVAKLFDIAPEMVEDQGFIDGLKHLLDDGNPTVVANSVAALAEIAETSGKESLFKIDKPLAQRLLAALGDCTEWGQVFILDSLSKYSPEDETESERLIDRIAPRLQHANAAVVLSAVKVILRYMNLIENADLLRTLFRKLAPPLVTLLSSEPEIQYVALRNINLIVQKRPTILAHEVKVFFCKYNDPIFVKLEKLEIMVRLASERNIEQVLLELKEYSTEVDVDFVRRSVRAIGRCAIQLENAAERCINTLLELIQTKVNYVVQEAIIVIKDIFRRYPNRYESIIATLCDNLETLDEPEAKASMIWIVGEYAERIDNADELLNTFLAGFQDETGVVQLQLLTATVKLFLKRPKRTQEMVQRVLNIASKQTDNPDLRDRAYVYWRLLSTSPDAARAVVLAERPVIRDDTNLLEPTLLDSLLEHISSLASIYHRTPESFVLRSVRHMKSADGSDLEEEEEEEEEEVEGTSGKAYGVPDLLDLATPPPAVLPAASEPEKAAPVVDMMDMLGLSATPATIVPDMPIVVEKDSFVLRSEFDRRDGKQVLVMHFTAKVPMPEAKFAIQFNKNTFGVVQLSQVIDLGGQLATPGSTAEAIVPMDTQPKYIDRVKPRSLNLEVALKPISPPGDVCFYRMQLNMHSLFVEDGELEKTAFITKWKEIPEEKEVYHSFTDLPSYDPDNIIARLQRGNVFLVARRTVKETQTVMYFSIKTSIRMTMLLEMKMTAGETELKMCIKTEQPQVSPFIQTGVDFLLRKKM